MQLPTTPSRSRAVPGASPFPASPSRSPPRRPADRGWTNPSVRLHLPPSPTRPPPAPRSAPRSALRAARVAPPCRRWPAPLSFVPDAAGLDGARLPPQHFLSHRKRGRRVKAAQRVRTLAPQTCRRLSITFARAGWPSAGAGRHAVGKRIAVYVPAPEFIVGDGVSVWRVVAAAGPGPPNTVADGIGACPPRCRMIATTETRQ